MLRKNYAIIVTAPIFYNKYNKKYWEVVASLASIPIGFRINYFEYEASIMELPRPLSPLFKTNPLT